MPVVDMRLDALESRIVELEGREAANRSITNVLARTLAQTGISAPQDIARTIDGWEAFYQPAKTASLPADAGDLDIRRQKAFLSTIAYFLDEARKALPRPATSE